MSDYTPSLEEARERYIDGFPIDTWVLARADLGAEFDRMIAQVRDAEREKADREPSEPVHVQVTARRGGKNSTLADMIVERANARGIRVEFASPDREPSDAEVEAAAKAMYRLTNELSVSGARDLARAALLAAQEVRRGSTA